MPWWALSKGFLYKYLIMRGLILPPRKALFTFSVV